MITDNVLVLNNVSKSFKKQSVLENLTIYFESGKIYGITGENGCGKTIILKILCGLMTPTKGEVIYNGKILKKQIDYLPSVGVIIENPGFFEELNAFDNLKILASFQNKINDKQIIEFINMLGLENSNKKIKNYSLGMKQRLGIAQAIMEDPDVLILDEFTSALDATGVALTHDLLRRFKEKGKIIVITSHSKHDIIALCDETFIVQDRGLIHV